MNESIEIAKELKCELEKLPLIQEYRKVKTLLENDPELRELKAQITKAKLNNDVELHKSLLDKYNLHPLVNNYQVLQEEVYEYLKQVSDIVNKK